LDLIDTINRTSRYNISPSRFMTFLDKFKNVKPDVVNYNNEVLTEPLNLNALKKSFMNYI